jgi:hypothetical protein
VQSQVRGIWTMEGEAVERVTPDDLTDVSEWVRVMAGASDGPGEESFDVHVCTPTWLQREVARTGFILGRHLLIVNVWDAATIVNTLTGLFSSISGERWSDIAQELSRIGFWEFEDYRQRTADGDTRLKAMSSNSVSVDHENLLIDSVPSDEAGPISTGAKSSCRVSRQPGLNVNTCSLVEKISSRASRHCSSTRTRSVSTSIRTRTSTWPKPRPS